MRHVQGRRHGRVVGLLAAVGLWLAPAVAPAAELSLERVFANLEFRRPLALVPAPRGEAWYLVEQRGRVWRLVPGAEGTERSLFVDITARVDDGPNEAGLLGLALHPGFADNGRVVLSYTGSGAPLVSRVSAFVSRDGGRTLDPGSERMLLTLDQPYGNHNGGQVAFGPDGYLYAGFGDGGAAGDPLDHGQNPDTLLGTLLRIDVDGGTPYAIPPDNPFAEGGGRPEIYAWGLRNPWRWSFDRKTGALWVADVGQNRWEEVNRVERGGNYGWSVREGAHCYRDAGCRSAGLIDPVTEYPRRVDCSITGGYVYRGQAMPALAGVYLYGDYCSGRIRGYTPASGEARILLDSDLAIAAFAEGPDGELYLLDHQGGGVYRLTW